MILSGYELIIDYGFDYCMDNQIIFALFINSDIQGYVEEFAEKEFKDIDEKKIVAKLNILSDELQKVGTPNKSDYKKAYLAFIKRLIKEHHVTRARGQALEDVDRATTKYTYDDDAVDKVFEMPEHEKKEQKRQKLELRYKPAGLSAIEEHALDFIRDRTRKDKSLDHFTLNGIFQIANRAALKIYFQNDTAKS